MSDSGLNRTYLAEDLRIIEVRARSGEVGEEDEHVNWFIGFAPELEQDEPPVRVVISTLHTFIQGGRADVTVGARFVSDGTDLDLSADDLAARIAGSSALETVYDFARSHWAGLAGILEFEGTVPRSSPEATVRPLGSGPDDEGSEASEAE